jgi:hypothetical protein
MYAVFWAAGDPLPGHPFRERDRRATVEATVYPHVPAAPFDEVIMLKLGYPLWMAFFNTAVILCASASAILSIAYAHVGFKGVMLSTPAEIKATEKATVAA